jgi:hypothetical protein
MRLGGGTDTKTFIAAREHWKFIAGVSIVNIHALPADLSRPWV